MDKNLSKKERKQLKLKQKLLEQQQQKQLNQNQGQDSEEGGQQHVDQYTNKKNPNSSKDSKKDKNQQKRKASKASSQGSKPESDDDNDNQDSSLDFNNVIEGEEVQVSFLVAEINEKQYHSMKTILEKFARITGIISSQWADAIISNSKAGNSVLADDDDEEQEQQQQEEGQEQEEQEDDEADVCNGVINILPYKNKLTKKIIEKVLKSAEGKNTQIFGKGKPSEILKENCSLLVCERAINLPAFIVKSMHEVLVSDLKELKKTNNAEFKKICGNYIIGLSDVELPKNKQVDIEQIAFSRFQDYLFIKNSACWWVGQSSPNSVKKFPLHKIYYIIPLQKYFQTVGQIESLVEEK